MKSSTLPVIFWLVLTICAPLCAPAQTKEIKKEPASSINGKVTINGKGAAGIIVGLLSNDRVSRQRSVIKSTTDHEGNYRLTNVPPGSYRVSPYAPNYVVSGDRWGKALVIAASESVEDIDFALSPGGVITGKVTDSEGRAVIEEQIILLRVEENKRPQPYMASNMMNQTDDRGVYRIFGIPPGRYRVALGQIEDNLNASGPSSSRYKQTFHPDVTDASKATVIEVSEGSEATNVDITVGRGVTTFSASGRIVDGETGRPLPNVMYVLQSFGPEQGSSRSTFSSDGFISDSKGEFKLDRLAPGKYAVFIVPHANNEMRSDPVTFDLIDQDVTGLEVNTSRGASVSGVVVLEGTNDKSVEARLRQAMLHAFVQKESAGDNWGQSAPLSPDGSFRVGGLQSGRAYFSLQTGDGFPRGFLLTRIERDGIPQASGLEIKEAEQVTGLRLVVRYGNGTIRGLIKIENGELPSAARFFVSLTRIGEEPRIPMGLPPPNVDSRGRFIVEDLPAGIYELNASVFIPESRNAPLRARQQVNVVDGTVTEVTITVELNSNPGPTRP